MQQIATRVKLCGIALHQAGKNIILFVVLDPAHGMLATCGVVRCCCNEQVLLPNYGNSRGLRAIVIVVALRARIKTRSLHIL